MVEIMVNGSKFEVAVDRVTYSDIAVLAGHSPEDDGLTIVYIRPPPPSGSAVAGTLTPGRGIDIEDRMTFDAMRTSAA